MKKLLFVIFLASLILFVGCKGTTVLDPIPPIVPPTIVKYTVEIVSDTNGVINPSDKVISVVSGANLPLSITSNFGYKVDTLLVNDFPVVLTGNTSGTINYTISNIEKNSKVEVIRGKNLDWYLTQGKWKCDSLYSLTNGVWYDYLLWGKVGALQFVYVFSPDGSYTLYESGKWFESGTWFISGEDTNSPKLNLKTSLGTQSWNIEKLDKEFLTLFRDDIPVIGDPSTKFSSMRLKYSQL